MHMHVNADALVATPGGGHAEISHLGADAGEGDETVDGGGDIGVVVGTEDLSGGLDEAGFIILES